jgi:hypothetical protein
MLAQSQPLVDSSLLPAGEISAADLLGQLAQHRGKKLIFRYEGRDVSIGYHVTEVKSGVFQALDCGANFESWHETFIQLWDVPPEDDRGLLPIAKFLAIIGKVAEAVPFDPKAKLTFEVSDGKRAMQLYRASSIEMDGDTVRVGLTQRPASCKPRDRWLDAQQTQSCCGTSSAGAKPCCN